MSAFAYELATLMAVQEQATGGHPDGAYAMPWYLVIGEPRTGKSLAIKALNMSWPRGDAAIPMNQPDPQCSYWMPEKAVFIEPGPKVVGPQRQHNALQELCYELKDKRAREPIDGMILIANLTYLADLGEDDVDRYAHTLRRYLIEVGQALAADVPTYVIATAYDGLWGFGDAFQWTAQRRDEEPWGFSLKPGITGQKVPAQIKLEMEGLRARIESICFDKLSGDGAVEARSRSFQHLSEALDVMKKLDAFMAIISMANAFERAPWIRALALGSGTPGTGHVLRHRSTQFNSMGYYPPQHSGTPQPGGMPIHAMLEGVLLPERDIVPTRIRWRDDKLLIALIVAGIVAWITFLVVAIVS